MAPEISTRTELINALRPASEGPHLRFGCGGFDGDAPTCCLRGSWVIPLV